MAKAPKQATLIRELESDADDAYDAGRVNNRTDLALSMGGIIASLIATVLAAVKRESIEPWMIAAVAAMPAAFASLQRVVEFRARSNWYFQYAARARAIAMRLKYADKPNVEKFAQQRADIEVDMEKSWSQIGRGGAAPLKGTRGR